MSAKFSIITVVYNNAQTIEDTLLSVFSQDYNNVEYIVIDGGSVDGTIDILRKYVDRISILISEPDKGIYDAMNKGIKLSTGDLVGILNGDDVYYDSNVLSSIVQAFEERHADAVYGDLDYVDFNNTMIVKRKWRSGRYKKNSFLWGWMPPHPTFFVKKSLYEKLGTYRLDLRIAADYELMLRFIHLHRINVAYLPSVLVKMREGGVSNASLKARFNANREDRKAWKINGIRPLFFTLFLKPLRKVSQLYF